MPGRLLGGTFEIYKDARKGTFHWRLTTRQGTVLMSSVQDYPSQAAAERAIELALSVAGGARIVEAT